MDADKPVQILRRGRGHDGEDYVEVVYKSGRKRRKSIVAVKNLSTNAMRGIGLLSSTSKSKFIHQVELALQNMKPSFRVADRSGWFEDNFIYPDGTQIGGNNVPVCLSPDYRNAGDFVEKGNLVAWRRVADFATGNSRVLLAFAHAFSGPVVDFLELEAPAIQLVGDAGVFKSSLAAAVAAVWGNRIYSWNRTGNSMESLALRHNATHLVLDDFRPQKNMAYRDLRAAAIFLADGRLRGRMGEQPRTWRTPVLSTSNKTLDEHARASKTAIDEDQDAVRGRLIEIPLVFSRTTLFETRHDFFSSLDLISSMSAIARDNAGCAAATFVEQFLQERRDDEEKLREFLIKRRKYYEAKAGHRFSGPQGYELVRLDGRMATIYASGCLAVKLGVTRWRYKQVYYAIMACHAAHVALVADRIFSSFETKISSIQALRNHVASRLDALVDLRKGLVDPSQHDHARCPGYIRLRSDQTLELLFSYQELERICGSKSGVSRLREEARSEGILFAGEARPSVKRFIYRGNKPEARVNVIAFRADGFAAFAPLPDRSPSEMEDDEQQKLNDDLVPGYKPF